MLNIPEYRNYSGETKIALMDNSTVAFLEQVERAGISAKELLIGYEVILIPNWVSEEICDSIYRKNFIESLVADGLPIYFIAGAKDPVGNNGKGVRKVVDLFKQYGMQNVQCKLYPYDRHEILNELDRYMVYEDVRNWLEEVIQNSRQKKEMDKQ